MPEFTYSVWFFLLVVLFYFGGRAADHMTSKDQIYTGLREGFFFSKNARGFYNPKKNAIASVAFGLFFIVLFFAVPRSFDTLYEVSSRAWVSLAIFGLASWAMAAFNLNKLKKERELQLRIVKAWENLPVGGARAEAVLKQNRDRKEWYYLKFAWFTSKAVDGNDAMELLDEQIHQFALEVRDIGERAFPVAPINPFENDPRQPV